jgi:hypothetical protein
VGSGKMPEWGLLTVRCLRDGPAWRALLSAKMVALFVACMAARCHAADISDFISFNDPTDGASRLNSVFVFYGRLSTTNLGSTLFFNELPLFTNGITGQRYDNFIAGASYQRDVYRLGGFVFSGEVGIADRFGHYKDCCVPSAPSIYTSGTLNSFEFWAGPAFHYDAIMLFQTVLVTPGITGGLSAVTSSIGTEYDRETTDVGGNATLLFYLGVDLGFSLVSFPQLELVIEAHHRSGANKLLGHMEEGYNANVAGLRYRF